MIFYFSGTGNSKWVAEQLAAKTDDTAINLTKLTNVPSIDNETVGIVFPIYAWGAPEPVIEFLSKLVGKPTFSYAVCTCGGETGLAMEKLTRVFPLKSTYSVILPSNYVMGAEIESDESIRVKIAKAKVRLDKIAGQITARQPVHDVSKGKFPWIMSNLANFGFNMAARSTKPFYVTDKCNACGQCVTDCPANTIRLVDGKPSWGAKCYQCTACINLCPTQAIQYGKGTAARGRYRLENYLEPFRTV